MLKRRLAGCSSLFLPCTPALAADLDEPTRNLAAVEEMLRSDPSNEELISMRDMLAVRGCASPTLSFQATAEM